ncbi:MAG: sigma 54-interacting transcriptional regulator [Candidatus Accumulibacter sp.]|nr:sigma 54-interacting transcriptional regulator [Accumulibacter sp.]
MPLKAHARAYSGKYFRVDVSKFKYYFKTCLINEHSGVCMFRLLFVAPYAGLANLAWQLGQNYLHDDIVLNVVEAIGVKCLDDLDFEADVVISRGATASALRQRLPPHIPVVELQVTGYDVIHTVHRCNKLYAPSRIFVVGAESMVSGVHGTAEALGVPIFSLAVTHEEDAASCLATKVDKKKDVVVGGGMAVRIARDMGFRAELIESGQESLDQAFGEAIRVARVAAREREFAGRIRTIVNAVDDGIVAFDESGSVTLYNTAACRLLGRESNSGASLLGRHLNEWFPGLDYAVAISSGKPDRGIVVSIGERQFAVTLLPVTVQDVVTGGVATFQEAARLQEVEGRVRSTLHRKGLKAKYTFADCLGESRAIRSAVEQARRFGRTDANLLIYGETGTGKEIFAQSMHNASRRCDGPFVAVNCAALPENLFESEFFGYVPGAFTGASRTGKVGLFELAHRGTIFLDEVSEIPLSFQGRLLRVLQEREVMRLGDDRIIPVDVRILAATNKDLKKMAESGFFRQDLLYRLDVLSLGLPPLRDRREDIPLLARSFLRRFGEFSDESGRLLALDAEELLSRYEWPGNVRELRNICERLVALSAAPHFTREEVQLALGLKSSLPDRDLADFETKIPKMRNMQCELVSQALKQTHGNKRQAALLLGISRSTLWRKIRSHDPGEASQAD